MLRNDVLLHSDRCCLSGDASRVVLQRAPAADGIRDSPSRTQHHQLINADASNSMISTNEMTVDAAYTTMPQPRTVAANPVHESDLCGPEEILQRVAHRNHIPNTGDCRNEMISVTVSPWLRTTMSEDSVQTCAIVKLLTTIHATWHNVHMTRNRSLLNLKEPAYHLQFF